MHHPDAEGGERGLSPAEGYQIKAELFFLTKRFLYLYLGGGGGGALFYDFGDTQIRKPTNGQKKIQFGT